jgi:hypothetical protein
MARPTPRPLGWASELGDDPRPCWDGHAGRITATPRSYAEPSSLRTVAWGHLRIPSRRLQSERACRTSLPGRLLSSTNPPSHRPVDFEDPTAAPRDRCAGRLAVAAPRWRRSAPCGEGRRVASCKAFGRTEANGLLAASIIGLCRSTGCWRLSVRVAGTSSACASGCWRTSPSTASGHERQRRRGSEGHRDVPRRLLPDPRPPSQRPSASRPPLVSRPLVFRASDSPARTDAVGAAASAAAGNAGGGSRRRVGGRFPGRGLLSVEQGHEKPRTRKRLRTTSAPAFAREALSACCVSDVPGDGSDLRAGQRVGESGHAAPTVRHFLDDALVAGLRPVEVGAGGASRAGVGERVAAAASSSQKERLPIRRSATVRCSRRGWPLTRWPTFRHRPLTAVHHPRAVHRPAATSPLAMAVAAATAAAGQRGEKDEDGDCCGSPASGLWVHRQHSASRPVATAPVTGAASAGGGLMGRARGARRSRPSPSRSAPSAKRQSGAPSRRRAQSRQGSSSPCRDSR